MLFYIDTNMLNFDLIPLLKFIFLRNDVLDTHLYIFRVLIKCDINIIHIS